MNEREKYQKYFDLFVTHGLYPQITLPTQVTKTSATLIDHLFYEAVDMNLPPCSDIVETNISDHYPYLLLLDIVQKSTHKPKYIKVNNYNENSLQKFCSEIAQNMRYCSIDRNLHSDPNANYMYNTFENIITKAREKHLAPKIVRFRKYKHKISPWITKGILKSIRFRDKLYRKLYNTKDNSEVYGALKMELSRYNSLLKKTIRQAKLTYYAKQFETCKNDMKDTWNTIKKVIGKHKNKSEFSEVFQNRWKRNWEWFLHCESFQQILFQSWT